MSDTEFWERQALKHGSNVAAVNFDPVEDEFSAHLYDHIIPDGLMVADFGCGNGRTLLALAKTRPNGTFVGYDFAENMVKVAEAEMKKLGLSNVYFREADVAAPKISMLSFDIIIGKRILINIREADARRRVLENIYSLLKPNGRYIMTECFVEPLQRISDIRVSLGLPPITVKAFNDYLTEEFKEHVGTFFELERRVDIGSLYYFISRVFNAYLSDGEPDYFAPINKLASRLVLAGVRPMEGYAPEVHYIFRRKEPDTQEVDDALSREFWRKYEDEIASAR